jgi:hypothetical protein
LYSSAAVVSLIAAFDPPLPPNRAFRANIPLVLIDDIDRGDLS